MSQFHWPIRVYFEDTDGGGVVYHSNYLNFMERARTEWLRSLGFGQAELKNKLNVIFVVRNIAIQYMRSACFDDALNVVTAISKTGRSLLVFEQTIYRENTILTQATVEVVCVGASNYKPASIPESIRLAMHAISSNNGV
jgi:acyl-CoA thioester hydrolase